MNPPTPTNPITEGGARFALNLYNQVRQTADNLFFSPYSIRAALSMCYAGAGGNTEAQMQKALHFPIEQVELHSQNLELSSRLKELSAGVGIELTIANALFPQEGFKLQRVFTRLLKKYYSSKPKPLDFSDAEGARNTINTWSEEQTAGKIKDLVPPGVLDAWTRLVLVNAIYFKGQWQHPFESGNTFETVFWTATGEQVPIQMMSQEKSFHYMENEIVQVLDLPYQSGELAMTILLPRQRDGLPALESQLTMENLSSWFSAMEKLSVDVFIPQFEMSYSLRLDESLQELGMTDAFSQAADFSGMDGQTDLYLSAALHKAFVTINESGTEAAAATALIMQSKSITIPGTTFKADHPFFFLIREVSSGTILFMGRLMKAGEIKT